jgi:hypothetical protein
MVNSESKNGSDVKLPSSVREGSDRNQQELDKAKEDLNYAVSEFEKTEQRLDRLLKSLKAAKAAKTLVQRVSSALSDDESLEYLRTDYLKALRENIQRIEDKYRQSFLTFVTFSAIFLILTRTQAHDISLGFFKIDDIKLVLQIFPALIAYWYYEMTLLHLMRSTCYVLHFIILANFYPQVSSHKLHYFLFSSSSLTDDMLSSFAERRVNKAIFYFSRPIRWILFFAPLPLEIYAFYFCFKSYGWGSPVIWFSLLISVIYLTQVLLCLIPTFDLMNEQSEIITS